MKRVRRGVALLGAALLLSGCASTPMLAPVASGDALSGRLAVNVDASDGLPARNLSAAFDLRGNADTGSLDLATPLGSVLARARWQPGDVVLATPQGEARYADLDSLSREALGEALPLAALFDWLRGRPWPGAASTLTQPPDEPGFRQLGWVVSLLRFDESQVAARREATPTVTLRARIDRP